MPAATGRRRVPPGCAPRAGERVPGRRRPAWDAGGGRVSRGEEETQEEEKEEEEKKEEERRSCPRLAGARQEREETLVPRPAPLSPPLPTPSAFT